MITGDDVLIEYVDRIIKVLKLSVKEDHLNDHQRVSIEKFLSNKVWQSQLTSFPDLCSKLEVRLNEMHDRRRRLIKYLYKKDNKMHLFEESYKTNIQQKTAIIRKFTAQQLEELLRTSTRNEAQQVVQCLIPQFSSNCWILGDFQKQL